MWWSSPDNPGADDLRRYPAYWGLKLVGSSGDARLLPASSDASDIFLGVDGGQSSTRAVIGDETGRVLGVGRGGPCNHAGAPEGRAQICRGRSRLPARRLQARRIGCRTRALRRRLPGIQRRPRG